MLYESGKYKVYAPSPSLIGQANGRSDIAGTEFSLRFWSDGPWQQKQPGELPPFVAVIGLHRLGSSALAGVLHKLGVHLGNQLGGYEPTGGFEAITLAHLCERAYPFPSTVLAVPREHLMRELPNSTICVSIRRGRSNGSSNTSASNRPICKSTALLVMCGRNHWQQRGTNSVGIHVVAEAHFSWYGTPYERAAPRGP